MYDGVDMIATPYEALLGKRREITGKHFFSLIWGGPRRRLAVLADWLIRERGA